MIKQLVVCGRIWNRPYGVGLCFGFVGEDIILPLKLDAFLFGRLIAYPYNVVISFGGNGWSRPTEWMLLEGRADIFGAMDKFGKVLRKYYMPRY